MKYLQYIQGDCVHNWVDSGLNAGSTLDVEITFAMEQNMSPSFGASRGVGTNAERGYYLFYWYGMNGTLQTIITNYRSEIKSNSGPQGLIDIDHPHTLTISPKAKTLAWDGTVVTTTISSKTPDLQVHFPIGQSFNYDETVPGGVPFNTEEDVCPIRIHGARFWTNDGTTATLVRDFVPVLENGVATLYDKVTGTVFQPGGTIPFTAGPVLPFDWSAVTALRIPEGDVEMICSSDYPLVPGAKRIEYLQGDCVHNWIDTGVQVSGLIDTELKMGFNADGNHYGASPTQYPDDPELYRGYTWLVQPYGTGTRLRLRTSGPGTYRNYVDSSNVWSVDVPHTLKISQTDKTLQVDGATVLTNVGQNATAVSNYIALCNSRSASGIVGGGNTESVCRLYWCKLWRDGTLVRDFVPIKVGNEGCLYDKVTATVYHNPGTVPFVCGAEVAETVIWKKPVPYDSEVEYLQSSGTQYIDTGITFEPAKSTVVTAKAAAPTDNRYVVVGSFTSASYAAMNIEFGGTANSHARQPRGYVKTVSSAAVDIWSGVTMATGVPADIELSYSATNGAVAIKVNGTTAATGTAPTTGTISGNDNFKLFLDSRADPSPIANAGRIYGVTIVKDGNTVLDLHPVRVGTTGYLFDRISWTLFGNAGTGAFGYGADVPSA